MLLITYIHEEEEYITLLSNYNTILYISYKENHYFDLKGAKIIKHMPNKKKRSAIESAVILLTETIIERSEKFQLSPTLAQLIITEHNINKYLR